MAGRLPIIDVAVSGTGCALRSLPTLLRLYWLPWLIGTLALVVLEAFVQDHLRLGQAPEWARTIVWAPFMAMIYRAFLRWALDRTVPRGVEIDVEPQTWLVAVVAAAWSLLEAELDSAPSRVLVWLAISWEAFGWDVSGRVQEIIMPYLYGLSIAAWLMSCALLASCFGLLVVTVDSGRPDLRAVWRLVRQHPARLFSIAMVAAAAAGGLEILVTQALVWSGAYELAPLSMIPWRANVHWEFIAHLPFFPLNFLTFVFESSILAEAYRRLLALQAAAPAPQEPRVGRAHKSA